MERKDTRKLNQTEQLEQRIRIIKLKEDGKPTAEVADMENIQPNRVRRVYRKYILTGKSEEAIKSKGKKGRHQYGLAKELDEAITKTILIKMPEEMGLSGRLWTRKSLQKLIEQQCGIKLHIRTVSKCLTRWGIVRKRGNWQFKSLKKLMTADSYRIATERTKKNNIQLLGLRLIHIKKTAAYLWNNNRLNPIGLLEVFDRQGHCQFMPYKEPLNSKILEEFIRRLTHKADKRIALFLADKDIADLLDSFLKRYEFLIGKVPNYRKREDCNEFLFNRTN